MKKDFEAWNSKKKHIDKNKRDLEFKEGEVWWSHFGINVGEEAYGKGEHFRRPVLILKKITQNSCIVVPTTTKIKEGENFYKFTTNNIERRAMLYQVKFISANRLYLKESVMPKRDLVKLKRSLAELLGISSWSPSGQEGQGLDHRITPDMGTFYQIYKPCQLCDKIAIMNDEIKKQNPITYFGITDARGKQSKFGIYKEDRLRHMYVIGKTGMGKSTLLENMAIQDIQNGEGMAYLDPHGTTAEKLLEFVPEHRIKDVIYFAPFDMEYPVALNVLEDTAAGDESSQSIRSQFIVSGLMSTFKKIWKDQWSARMEYILNYTLLALLEIPEATLLDVNRMLSDKAFRKDVIDRLKEPTVKSYWEKEFASMTDKMVAEAVPAIQNKVGQFISNALIRNIIGQTTSSFDFRKAMDEKKIIIFNLSIGRIGEDAVNLLGSLFVTKIYLAAMSRADISEQDMKAMPNFYLYVDEFQNFINDSFAQILSQARKYKLGLIVAHQYVKQMSEIVHDAVFGNVGTMIAFRIGADDADAFEKEFKPVFLPEDFTNIGRFQMYLKLMIDGVASNAFSAAAMGPWERPQQSFVKEIIDSSRVLYSHPRQDVEAHILKWTLGGDKGGKAEGTPQPKTEQPRKPEQSRAEPRREERPREQSREPRRESPRPEPRREERPRTERPIQVHNPFKTAFQEIEKPVEEKKPVVEDVKKVPEITFETPKPDKKEIDEDTLKDVLGLRE